MRITLNLFVLIVFLNSNYTHGQESYNKISDSTKAISLVKKSIIPITLIGLGILANNSNFEKQLQLDLRNKVGNNYELRIDNYIQYVPIAEIYTADALGIKAKNHWFDQTKYLLISNLISSTLTHGLKKITQKERPNGSPNSFPSGHTTFSFTNATVLFNEFKETAPVLAYSGYAFATTTGAFRMINNKHWLSDVLLGAGIGVLVTELVYHFEPFKNFNPFKKSKNITLIPQINNDNYGVYFVYYF